MFNPYVIAKGARVSRVEEPLPGAETLIEVQGCEGAGHFPVDEKYIDWDPSPTSSVDKIVEG